MITHIHNQRLKAILICLVCFGGSGCIREIDFELPADSLVVVMDGHIHAGPGPYEIDISLSSPYGREATKPLEGVAVWLVNEAGEEEVFVQDPASPGKYICEGQLIRGEVGAAYHIQGTLPDGTSFHSEPETIPFPTKITNIDYSFREVRTINRSGIIREEWFAAVEVGTQFPLLKEGPYLRWETDEMWVFRELDQGNPLVSPKTCYITETSDPQRIDVFNGQLIKTSIWDEQEVIFRPLDFTFKDLHYFNVYQFTTSAKALEYWERLERVANQQGSIFDVPPALIRGNIRQDDNPDALILGYFEAVTIDTARAFSTPFDLPNIDFPGFCDFRGGFTNYQIPDACFECLLYPEATLERPDYLD
ncbi:MAG: DUF4249 domain-containing protein [Bacteroidota bacterium]